MEGVDRGEVAGFALYRLDLSRIPDQHGFEAFFPAATDDQARRFLHSDIFAPEMYNRYLQPLFMLHPKLWSEELPMVKLTREEMLELDVRGNVELWTSLLGVEETLEVLGPEEALEALAQQQGLSKLQRLLARMEEQKGGASGRKPSARTSKSSSRAKPESK